MDQVKLALPRTTILMHVGVAVLAAMGLTSLLPGSGGSGQGVVLLVLMSALVALALGVRTRVTVDQARQEGGRAAAMDPATGVATAAIGDQALAREFAAAQRGRTLSVALIQIENLGRYRSAHGRAVTDQLLRDAGRVLVKHRRGMHLAARYGKGQGTFLSILSGVDGRGAAVYGARVRREISAVQGVPRPTAVNVGIAVFDMSLESPEELLGRAEYALSKGASAGGKVVAVGETQRQHQAVRG